MVDVWFLLNVALSNQGEAQRFSYRRVQGVFLKDFHVHVAAVEYKSVLSVW